MTRFIVPISREYFYHMMMNPSGLIDRDRNEGFLLPMGEYSTGDLITFQSDVSKGFIINSEPIKSFISKTYKIIKIKSPNTNGFLEEIEEGKVAIEGVFFDYTKLSIDEQAQIKVCGVTS